MSIPVKNQGFLLIAVAVLIIIFVSVASAFLITISRSSSDVGIHTQAIPQANGVAESGLQEGTRQLNLPLSTPRPSCNSILVSNTLNTGSYTINKATGITNPNYNSSTLSTAIASSGSIANINVANSGNFSANGGRVLIGREVFQYRYTINGDTTNLYGITRAVAGSSQAIHNVGDVVSQNQCIVASAANSPDTTNIFGIRNYQEGIQQPSIFVTGDSGTILLWNNDTSQLSWSAMTSGTTLNLNGISALNYHNAWAVGDAPSTSTCLIARLHGSNTTWTSSSVVVGTSNGRNLNGVSATSDQEAWAVGNFGGNSSNFILLHWISSTNTWTLLPTATSCSTNLCVNNTDIAGNERNLYAIQTLDYTGDGIADFGVAVGGSSDLKHGHALVYVNSSAGWNNILKFSSDNIGTFNAVSFVKNGSSAPTQVFAAGVDAKTTTKGKIVTLIKGASTWTYTVFSPTVVINGIAVIDTNNNGSADFGIAVGNSGNVYTYNGTSWSAPITISTSDLHAVIVNSTTDIWVTGANGVRYHYDGTHSISTPSSWVNITAGSATSNSLSAISSVPVQDEGVSSWYEVIN